MTGKPVFCVQVNDSPKETKKMNANTVTISADAQAIVSALEGAKGQNLPFTFRRDMDTRKDVTARVEKQTSCYVRTGVDYANLASVQAGIASGERGEVQPLPTWQEWACAPYILRHKGNGTEYVRVFPASFANLKPSVTYFIDGREATIDEVKPLCLAKEFRERDEAPAVFNIKVNSILKIGR